jgi:Flp pilus assembly protein TadG
VSARRDLADTGQSLVEFALLLPLFVLLLFAVLDGGRLIYLNSVVSQAAREAARVAAVEASWIGSTDLACGTTGGPVCPAGIATGSPSLKADALAAANRMTAPFGSISGGHIYISCDQQGSAPTGAWTGVSCANASTNNVVSVRVELQFAPLTPIIGQLIGSPVLSGSATMVVN